MRADFRALCADLLWALENAIRVIYHEDGTKHISTANPIVNRARAALADEPAVPEVVGSEWQPCVKLPITVHVREQRPGEQHVLTREGITPVQPDDLIMLGVDGEEYPIGRELFQRTYRMGSADEPAVPEGREPAAGEVAGLVADLQQQANHGFSDLTRNLLISLASHMAYMQGQLQARHDPDEDDLEDCYWYAESVTLRQMVADHLAAEAQQPSSSLPELRSSPADGEMAELVERPAPVAVSERPWEREGWCDTDGLCWLGSDALDGCTPTWLYGPPAWAERFPNVHRVLLPTHALPLPEVGD